MELINFIENNIVFIVPEGRIDTTNSNDFQNLVSTIINEQNKVALDFAKINYISSAGLRAILMLAKQTSQNNGKFVIYSMNDNIKDIFDMAGFSSIIKIVKTKDDAENEVS
jgi:anti-anti-sigma factor